MILTYIKKFWELLNSLSPQTRNIIIILLVGFVFYSQICNNVKHYIAEKIELDVTSNKNAENYTKEKAIEINKQVKLIADKDQDAFDVLLLSYHNSTQSLQGLRYLYLTCIAESPKQLDTPLLKPQWDNIDYIYYADELERIHNQSFVHIKNLEDSRNILPKLYRLIKSSEAQSVSFYTVEGYEAPVGIVVILYKNPKTYTSNYQKIIVPSIQRLAILLDYDNIK